MFYGVNILGLLVICRQPWFDISPDIDMYSWYRYGRYNQDDTTNQLIWLKWKGWLLLLLSILIPRTDGCYVYGISILRFPSLPSTFGWFGVMTLTCLCIHGIMDIARLGCFEFLSGLKYSTPQVYATYCFRLSHFTTTWWIDKKSPIYLIFNL